MRRSALAAALLASVLAWAGDPAHYVQRQTWQETLRLSREALVRQEAEARKARLADPAVQAFQPVTLETKLGDRPRRLRVRVAGLERLCLRIERPEDQGRQRATVCFGNPRLFNAEGEPTAVTRRTVTDVYGNRHFGDERSRRWKEAKLDAQALKPEPGLGGQDADVPLELEAAGEPEGRFARGFLQGCDGECVLRLDGKLPPGATHHPDLSFDGSRILFAYCDQTPKDSKHRRFWIHEIGVAGTCGGDSRRCRCGCCWVREHRAQYKAAAAKAAAALTTAR